MDTPQILVVDDEQKTVELVAELLERHHMRVYSANSVSEAEASLNAYQIDLIVLDVMMPGEDGVSFCRRLRQDSTIPILMLSAMGDDIDRIIGLEMGADDYLAKPFNPRELIARIRTILRRAPAIQQIEQHDKQVFYAFNQFTLNPDMRTLQEDGSIVDLTSGEFAVLLALVERAPRILSRDQLLEYSRGAAANPFDRSIDTHISRLRSKLEKNTRRPELIKTVRNLGYAFAATVEKVSE
ncbi:MAG: response regulator [Pseudomonadota bacterium]